MKHTRWIACIAGMLLALALGAVPAGANTPGNLLPPAPGSVIYGGPDADVDNDTEVRAVVDAMADEPTEADQQAILDSLTPTEQDLVIDRGLTPVTTEGGLVEGDTTVDPPTGEPGTVTESRVHRHHAAKAKRHAAKTRRHHAKRHRRGARAKSASRVWRTVTFYCQSKSAVGLILWRYNSRWSWQYGGLYVFDANHTEWGGQLAPLWSYHGSQNLWRNGALGTSYFGRATEGTFNFGAGFTIFQRRPINDPVVYGDGGYWHQCLEN